MQGRRILCLVVGMLFICLLPGVGWPSSRPDIIYMRTCDEVTERPTQFEASGWTSSFGSKESVYCVVKADIPPHDAPRGRSYDATMSWYTPGGELYYEHDYNDLERGYIWSLWGSIYDASLTGEWRVVFSVKYGARKSLILTVYSSSSPDDAPFPSFDFNPPEWPFPSEPGEEPVIGREQEPNETAGTANLLAFDEKVQGEVLFYSEDVYDQDWYRIELAGNEEYWLEVNAVGMTSQWLSPFSFLGVYVYQEAALVPMSLSWEAQQEVSEDRSLCDAVAPIQGPGTYYIFILAKDCEHDIYYSLQIATSKPEAAEGES